MASTVPVVSAPSVLRILKQGGKALRELKKVDPRLRYVLLYPSSDNVYPGMGFNLIGCKPAEEIYERASNLTKKNLLKLCLDGPLEKLRDSIENRHLAAFVTSHATFAKLKSESPHIIENCSAAGGFGIGFMNCLVQSGSMSFEDSLEFIQKQAEAMHRAGEVVKAAQVYVHLRPATSKIKICRGAIEHCIKLGIPKEIAVCNVVSHLKSHRIVLAGHEEAIKYLENDGKRLFEFRKLVRREGQNGSYHTNLMAPVSQYLSVYLNEKIEENPDFIKDPQHCSVYSAATGERCRYVKHIKKALIDFPVSSQKVEHLIQYLFKRPKSLAQPNTLVIWDRHLHRNLNDVNRRAWSSSKLVKA